MSKPLYEQDEHKEDSVKRKRFLWRINIFFFAVFVLFSALIIRLAIIQFVEGKDLKAQEQRRTESNSVIPPVRGNIMDKDGQLIAFSRTVQSLYFQVGGRNSSKKDRQEVVDMAKKLSEALAKFTKSGETPMSTEEILAAMDPGFDMELKTKAPKSAYSEPRKVKADLSKEEVAYLMEHRDEFKGIDILEESIREYQHFDDRPFAAQLIGYMKVFGSAKNKDGGKEKYQTIKEGYTNGEEVGFDGIEFMYQDELRGKEGSKTYPVNSIGKITGKPEITPPVKGNNLFLTIKKDVQMDAQKAVEEQLSALKTNAALRNKARASTQNPRSAFVVAIEVDTGKVVAMVNYPDYDTNVWKGGRIKPEDYNKVGKFINNGSIRTMYGDYPDNELNKHPSSIVYLGSVIKPLSVLVGFKEGLFNPNTIYQDTGVFTFGKDKRTIRNAPGVPTGSINAQMALKNSSNTFMSEMIGMGMYRKYGNNENDKSLQVLDSYYKQFGLGTLTGSGLPSEYPGSSEFLNTKNDSVMDNIVRASWGQKGKYSTLQLAQYAATLASRGKRMQPQFVDKITDIDGNVVQGFEPKEMPKEDGSPDVTLSETEWQSIIGGMRSNAYINAQGTSIDTLPYDVARKTGTSTEQYGGKTVDNGVFISFAPRNNPKLAVAVVVPEGGYGSWSAAPIAAKIYESYDKNVGGLSQPAKE
ncbi:penicillin-binding protein 2 [Paenibacillus larvae]|uniref:peptidoglycan D,D-transpeptidase FtsI family protein n=1 Tax=Paenibacillus larvae TaxID=1464 RepID=UPI00227D9DB6|nr:penicillin-binding transpeptidase domain-containing protein [Paenibacillus larvae]MCY9509043.1 penicillin-binding protein 2 [Paenibacillus larvae]MCY9526186.1 penicillin-binding protein 2 [Paenibacillus larvae]